MAAEARLGDRPEAVARRSPGGDDPLPRADLDWLARVECAHSQRHRWPAEQKFNPGAEVAAQTATVSLRRSPLL